MGYRRIYADLQGTLFADDQDVFGATAAKAQEGNLMSMYEDPDFGFDDFGEDEYDDEFGQMDYLSLGDDDDYDDDLGLMQFGDDDDDDEDDEFGRRRRRGGRGRRGRRRGGRRGRRPSRRRRPSRPRPRPAAAKPKVIVQKTILTGQSAQVLLATADATVTIRPQYDFVAEDVTFTGSASLGGGNWTIASIQFGDRIVFSNPTGVPVAVFATNSFVRGMVKGGAIKAGLDILVNGNFANGSAGSTSRLSATFTGLKRGSSGCLP